MPIMFFILEYIAEFEELLFGFQDPAAPSMDGIIDLHNYIFFYATLILFFVLWILINILYFFFYKVRFQKNKETVAYRYLLFSGNKVTHGALLEIVWTVIPAAILVAIAIPSFILMYAIDEVVDSYVSVKVVGHQWYWSYEYSRLRFYTMDAYDPNWFTVEVFAYTPKFSHVKFDSYMLAETDLTLGQLRLLEVDNTVVLPTDLDITILVTASDVLHSWAVPSLGIKIDAVPGRLNQVQTFIEREGVFYGQCSEICGVNHGFMPIVIKAVSPKTFCSWTYNAPRERIVFPGIKRPLYKPYIF